MRTIYVASTENKTPFTWASYDLWKKNSCLCIYGYRTMLFCEARGNVNKLYLKTRLLTPASTTHWRISANSSRYYHDFHKTWSTETLLDQLNFVAYIRCNFWVNLPKAVFFTPVRLRVETSFSLSRSTRWRLFMRKRRCSEDTGLQIYVYS